MIERLQMIASPNAAHYCILDLELLQNAPKEGRQFRNDLLTSF